MATEDGPWDIRGKKRKNQRGTERDHMERQRLTPKTGNEEIRQKESESQIKREE